MVRLWGVQRSSGGDAGKLKLRNGVYVVTAKRNDLYDLRHATHPELTKTNVFIGALIAPRALGGRRSQAPARGAGYLGGTSARHVACLYCVH